MKKHKHKLIHRGSEDRCECGARVECPVIYGAPCRGEKPAAVALERSKL